VTSQQKVLKCFVGDGKEWVVVGDGEDWVVVIDVIVLVVTRVEEIVLVVVAALTTAIALPLVTLPEWLTGSVVVDMLNAPRVVELILNAPRVVELIQDPCVVELTGALRVVKVVQTSESRMESLQCQAEAKTRKLATLSKMTQMVTHDL